MHLCVYLSVKFYWKIGFSGTQKKENRKKIKRMKEWNGVEAEQSGFTDSADF